MENALLLEIQEELEQHIDPAPKRSPQSFFRDEVKVHGVKTNLVEKIAKDRFQQIKDRSKEEILALCEELWKTDYMEEAFIACEWAYRLEYSFEPADFLVFERWVTKYVNNWAKCDTLCNHTVAAFVERYPQYVENLEVWARSDIRWLRRAAAVTLILPARKGKFLRHVFQIADILLLDKDDLVQKGYGWMLKEASKSHLQDVFSYVMDHKDVMPRTALRYAIEKMPEEMRRRAMWKEASRASMNEAIKKAQESVRKYVPEGQILSGELIRERREEARREKMGGK
jgi:3-methyladenine DNA glycosylase AlkD